MMHPIIEAYIKQGWFNSILRQWQRTHGIKIHVESNSSMEILEFHSTTPRALSWSEQPQALPNSFG